MSDDWTKVPRARHIQPTDDKLKTDCTWLAQRMWEQWDGEVDFLIVSTRRDGTANMQWATTIPEKSKLQVILKEVARVEAVSLVGKG